MIMIHSQLPRVFPSTFIAHIVHLLTNDIRVLIIHDYVYLFKAKNLFII